MSRINSFIDEARSVSPDDAVTGLLGAYSQHGYEEGYVRGRRELLAELPLAAEQFLRRHPEAGAQAQRLVRAFAQFLGQQASGESEEEGANPYLFEGGLGI